MNCELQLRRYKTDGGVHLSTRYIHHASGTGVSLIHLDGTFLHTYIQAVRCDGREVRVLGSRHVARVYGMGDMVWVIWYGIVPYHICIYSVLCYIAVFVFLGSNQSVLKHSQKLCMRLDCDVRNTNVKECENNQKGFHWSTKDH